MIKKIWSLTILLSILALALVTMPGAQAYVSTTELSAGCGHWNTDGDWIPAPARTFTLNYTNSHDTGPSWQIPLTPYAGSYDSAVDHDGITIHPGQNVTFSAWIKTSAPTVEGDNVMAGGRLGIDVYGVLGDSYGMSGPTGLPETSELNTYVVFGTSEWTFVRISFTVPSTYTSNQVTWGRPIGTVFTPGWAIPWVQTWSGPHYATERGTAWFSDIHFYIDDQVADAPDPTNNALQNWPTLAPNENGLSIGSVGTLVSYILGLGLAGVVTYTVYKSIKKDVFEGLIECAFIFLVVGSMGIIGFGLLLGNL